MAISFKELGYTYNKESKSPSIALQGINLDIELGKVTALIGETGSGKSTLVQHLNALLTPTEGELEILDYKLIANKKTKGLKQLRKKVGLVFQFSEYQLFEETLLKDVAFGPMNFGLTPQEAKIKAINALKLVGIDEKLFNRSPLDLSGGQKRRVAIAGILAIEPEVLVLDEPTAGLDPAGSKEMINLFMKLNKEYGKTIIIVSHDNDIVYSYADNVVLLNKGRVIYKGDTISFFNNDELIDSNDILRPKLVSFKKLLKDKGFKVSDSSRTLKEVVNEVKREIRR